ncbi:hypothetical protein G7K_0011-t1 [Saitoella complicata NRRL Y-17804]|uniref:Uncharacterized protein n=1 Tax=Saitoella complicata (strain BCRC 22490 / CBS 7301 / JCM 7358 / NBRC 10748 / NRRL Y-17804) TaxID=698492 RepID=A0A0E9N7F2_SAICN|nr:hypothetical protein G7K_0011-t1 [Saitoella complicata NRRL Y-17804]
MNHLNQPRPNPITFPTTRPRNSVLARQTLSSSSASVVETVVLLTGTLQLLEGNIGTTDTRQEHGTEGGSHAVSTVNLGQLHTTDDESRDDLTDTLDDRVLSGTHVQTAHTTELTLVLGKSVHGLQTLNTESTERSVVTSGRDNDRSRDGVGVHAGLVVVVEGDEGPVGDTSGNTETLLGTAGDQVLNSGSVEQLDVGELQDLGQEGRGQQGSVLDDNVVTLVLVRNANGVEELVGGLTADHGREQLTTQPGTATGSDTCLNDSDLQVRATRSESEGSGETAGTGTDDDDVRLGVVVHVAEVAAGHGAGNDGLVDRTESEGRGINGGIGSGGVLGSRGGVGVSRSSLHGVGHLVGELGRSGGEVDSGRRSHCMCVMCI